MKNNSFATAILCISFLAACAQPPEPTPVALPIAPATETEVVSTITPRLPSPEPAIPTPTGEAIFYGLRSRMGEGYADLGVFRYDPKMATLAQVSPEGWNLQDVTLDGSRLLLNQGSDLFLANSDGSGMKLISDNFFDSGSRGAAWKKDGSGVIYILTGENGTSIVSADLNSGAPQAITTSGESPIEIEAISPSGDIYWQKGTCSGEGICQREGVYRSQPEDGNSEKLDGIKRVRLSSDGSKIAYAYENESGKSSLGLTGTDLAERTGIALPGDLLGDFAWSPDGTRIAAVRYDRSDYSGKVSGTRNFMVDPVSRGVKELPESSGLLGGVLFSSEGTKLLLSSSVQTGDNFALKFQLVDLASGDSSPLENYVPAENTEFILLTNVFWVGK
jgi:hypothetical protein